MENDIQIVTSHKLGIIIETRKPLGLFMALEEKCWVAVDNSTGDAWTEEFKSKDEAISWLHGEFEISWLS